MPLSDGHTVRIDTNDAAAWQRQNGREVCPLFSSDIEQVCLQRLAPGQTVWAASANGAELLVLDGSVVMAGQPCARGSWLRVPEGDAPDIAASAQGATVYLKTGHLTRTALAASSALQA